MPDKKYKLEIKTTEDNNVYMIEKDRNWFLEAEYDNGNGSIEIDLDVLMHELRDAY